ncbi:MAG: GNAT family N-acetyltransferase [Candidatus Binatia bacterium]
MLRAEGDLRNRPFIVAWSREHHASALADPDIGHLIIERAEDAEPVGFVLLAGLASPHRTIELRRIVVTSKRRGYGREAVRAVKRLAFVERGAHRLWLDVKEGNERARRLYGSEGFVIEGVLRECLESDGRFESLVVMSMLESEYR